jgi:hypothetical protein
VAEQRGQRSLQWDSQGGQMVSSAGQNYAWLAESLRRTAQLDSGDFAALGVGLALLLPSFFKDCNYATPDDCGCKPACTAPQADIDDCNAQPGKKWDADTCACVDA